MSVAETTRTEQESEDNLNDSTESPNLVIYFDKKNLREIAEQPNPMSQHMNQKDFIEKVSEIPFFRNARRMNDFLASGIDHKFIKNKDQSPFLQE